MSKECLAIDCNAILGGISNRGLDERAHMRFSKLATVFFCTIQIRYSFHRIIFGLKSGLRRLVTWLIHFPYVFIDQSCNLSGVFSMLHCFFFDCQ